MRILILFITSTLFISCNTTSKEQEVKVSKKMDSLFNELYQTKAALFELQHKDRIDKKTTYYLVTAVLNQQL